MGRRRSHGNTDIGTETFKKNCNDFKKYTREPSRKKSSLSRISETNPLADKKVACDQVLTLPLIVKSNHPLAKRLIMDFMDFEWVFERLHHDSLESNSSC